MNVRKIQGWFGRLIVLLTITLTSVLVSAEPMLDKDFLKTAQIIPIDNPSKIEVVEVFWYGCSHCYHMDPLLDEWLKKLPDDVIFKRMPGLPQPAWEPMAKTYYAMEDLGILDQYHHPLFEAIHGPGGFHGIASNEKAAMAWMVKISGLDIAKVEAAFNSFSMKNRLARAANYFRASGATGVPSLVVNGLYITSGTIAGSNENAIKVTDYIIENIRAEKAKAPSQ